MSELRFASSAIWARFGRVSIDPAGTPAGGNSGGGTTAWWPDEAGRSGVPAGTVLTRVPQDATSGSGWTWNGTQVRPTANGVTISGLDVQSSIDASAKTGVIIEKCLVRGIGEGQFLVSLGGGGSILRDSELGGGANGTTFVGTSVSNSPIGVYSGGSVARNNTIQRVSIHHTSDGIRGDGGTYLVDSWVHTLNCGQVPGVHSDGLQQTAGSGLMEIEHNVIQAGTNDGVFPEVGTSEYLITRNKFVGDSGPDGNSSFGVGGKTTNPPFGKLTITDNIFVLDAKLGAAIGNFPAGQVVVRSGNKDQNGNPLAGG